MAADRSGKYVKMGRCSFSCGKIQLFLASSGVLLDSLPPCRASAMAAIRPPGMKWAKEGEEKEGSFALEIRGKGMRRRSVVDMTGVG